LLNHFTDVWLIDAGLLWQMTQAQLAGAAVAPAPCPVLYLVGSHRPIDAENKSDQFVHPELPL
jgi:hypothetical protein